jgi:hypothetical protein
MTRTLKRIAPLQLAKMMGVLYALMGLLFVPFFLLFAAIGAFAQHGSNQNVAPGALALGGGLVMALLFPVMYGVGGFILGAITAALYNVVARWVGGVEVEVE